VSGPVELRLGRWGGLSGGSWWQRRLSGLLVLAYVPAVAVLLFGRYLAAALLAVLATAVVAALARAVRTSRPGAPVAAYADDSGIGWSTDHREFFAWASIERVELGMNQPGGRLIAAMGMNTGTVRTGDDFVITVVSGGVPHEVTPVRGAYNGRRVPFGEGVAALARAHGVRVRVLTLGWGREDANVEDVRLG
jgi:hypothetical protein